MLEILAQGRIDREGFLDQRVCGVFETLLEDSLKLTFFKSGWNGFEELNEDLAWAAQKAAARPEQSSVQCDGETGRVTLRINTGDAIFINWRGADGSARPLWKNEDLSPL